ncbi:MAG: hypothetical protein IPM56_14455 [Ignavibacteriales bacterium]|nr:MAG: hypothetical protein IPM56_14455 [Ignavibacteriales bacterium]
MNTRIKEIDLLLHGVLNDISTMEDENFDANFSHAKESMVKVQKLKNELKMKFSSRELSRFEGELLLITKQIQKEFDNIVADKKKELAQVSAELEIVRNQKKLAIYLG